MAEPARGQVLQHPSVLTGAAVQIWFLEQSLSSQIKRLASAA
jgi:hypothetical protein